MLKPTFLAYFLLVSICWACRCCAQKSTDSARQPPSFARRTHRELGPGWSLGRRIKRIFYWVIYGKIYGTYRDLLEIYGKYMVIYWKYMGNMVIYGCLPSGKRLQFAIENGPWKELIYLFKMGIFYSL